MISLVKSIDCAFGIQRAKSLYQAQDERLPALNPQAFRLDIELLKSRRSKELCGRLAIKTTGPS